MTVREHASPRPKMTQRDSYHRFITHRRDLLGREASRSGIFILTVRLSLLEGRVGLSPSAALAGVFAADSVGVLPRPGLPLEAIVAGCCELLAALEDRMDEEEVFGRADPATAGGVTDRVGIAGTY